MTSNHQRLDGRPRSEPEIIPPESDDSRGIIWTSVDERGERCVYVTRLGPFSVALLLLAIAAIAAVVGILLIGTFLIWIPVVALLFTSAMISAWWRRAFRR